MRWAAQTVANFTQAHLRGRALRSCSKCRWLAAFWVAPIWTPKSTNGSNTAALRQTLPLQSRPWIVRVLVCQICQNCQVPKLRVANPLQIVTLLTTPVQIIAPINPPTDKNPYSFPRISTSINSIFNLSFVRQTTWFIRCVMFQIWQVVSINLRVEVLHD